MSKMRKNEIFLIALAFVYWFVLGLIGFFLYQSAFEAPDLSGFLGTLLIVVVIWILMLPVGWALHKLLVRLNEYKKNLGFYIGAGLVLFGIIDFILYVLTFYAMAHSSSPLHYAGGILDLPLLMLFGMAFCMFATPSLVLITWLKGRKHDKPRTD